MKSKAPTAEVRLLHMLEDKTLRRTWNHSSAKNPVMSRPRRCIGASGLIQGLAPCRDGFAIGHLYRGDITTAQVGAIHGRATTACELQVDALLVGRAHRRLVGRRRHRCHGCRRYSWCCGRYSWCRGWGHDWGRRRCWRTTTARIRIGLPRASREGPPTATDCRPHADAAPRSAVASCDGCTAILLKIELLALFEAPAGIV